jgi:hypothetical protein
MKLHSFFGLQFTEYLLQADFGYCAIGARGQNSWVRPISDLQSHDEQVVDVAFVFRLLHEAELLLQLLRRELKEAHKSLAKEQHLTATLTHELHKERNEKELMSNRAKLESRVRMLFCFF